MSGEETLAQVYREVESPEAPQLQEGGVRRLRLQPGLTAGISFLAVLLIPDEVRMKVYSDNLIGGLAMHVIGPPLARLLLERLRRGGRLPDPRRRRQHGDYRLATAC